MALKETTANLRRLLLAITNDIEKADRGNKAASQRVRTNTVKLEKTAKLYRKESISFEKKNKGVKKVAKKAPIKKATAKPAKTAATKGAAAKAPATKAPAAKASAVKVKAKAKTHKATARPRAFALKKPTAKIPQKKKKKSWLEKIF